MARTRAKARGGAPGNEDETYTLGSVWSVEFIRVEHGRFADYARHLVTAKKVLEEQRKEGLVLSYKFLSGQEVGPDDFTTMVLVEHPDWATFDKTAKFAAATRRVYGSLRARGEGVRKREEIRETMGMRLMQEIHPR